MARINPFIFRAYDVRGKVGIDITPEVFAEVGRAYGTLVRRRGGRAVAVGMDNRTTSPPLKEAFASGMLNSISASGKLFRGNASFSRISIGAV